METQFIVMCFLKTYREHAIKLFAELNLDFVGRENNKNPSQETKEDASALFFFEKLSDAEIIIKKALPNFSVIILVDTVAEKIFLYKGPEVEEIISSEIPRFLKKIQNIGIDISLPFLQNIEDLRILHQNKKNIQPNWNGKSDGVPSLFFYTIFLHSR